MVRHMLLFVLFAAVNGLAQEAAPKPQATVVPTMSLDYDRLVFGITIVCTPNPPQAFRLTMDTFGIKLAEKFVTLQEFGGQKWIAVIFVPDANGTKIAFQAFSVGKMPLVTPGFQVLMPFIRLVNFEFTAADPIDEALEKLLKLMHDSLFNGPKVFSTPPVQPTKVPLPDVRVPFGSLRDPRGRSISPAIPSPFFKVGWV